MRKPRDIQNYRTPAQAAAWLRGLADDIEKNEHDALLKVTTDIRWYYPDLPKAPAHGEATPDPTKCPHPSVTCARCWQTWTP